MRAAIFMFMFVVGTATAFAGPEPWADGVSDTQKANAKARLEEGNTLFLAQNYKDALAKYEAATKEWDHPAIRFNIVRCLIQLDKPVEASDNLQLALKYGAEPLEDAVYTEALAYQKLLANQISHVEVGCTQSGTKLTLDGEALTIACPGKDKRRVKPGPHSVVATKDGFLTKETRVVVVGGATESVEVKLVPLDKAAKVVHRWATWKPWLVFGSGLAVVGFGTLMQIDARGRMNDYDQRVASACAVNGCNLNDGMEISNQLKEMKSSAETRNTIAVSVITVGAVATVAGGVLLFMNRGKTVYEDPVKPGAQVNVLPTQDGGMVSVSGRF